MTGSRPVMRRALVVGAPDANACGGRIFALLLHWRDHPCASAGGRSRSGIRGLDLLRPRALTKTRWKLTATLRCVLVMLGYD